MKNENFIVIHGWMSNHLNLFGIERELYAIIYGFSQDGESKFTGTLKYLMDWTGNSRTNVIRHLKTLEKRGLITKHVTVINKVTFNAYTCNVIYAKNQPEGGTNLARGGTNLARGGTNLAPGGGTNLAPNNIVTEKDKEKYSSSAQDAQTTTDGSSSLFDEQIYDISVVPEFVIDFIETACRKRGMPEDDIPAFLMSLEENCNHVKIDRYRRSPGLIKLIDKSMANNFATHGSCPGSR